MNQAEAITQLQPGSTYWIEFLTRTKTKRWMPLIVKEIDGQAKGAGIIGNPFDLRELPDQILTVRKMNEFVRLQWMSRQTRRLFGDTPEVSDYEAQAYRAMPDEFYLTRLERLTQIWDTAGGVNSSRVKEEIAILRRLRPDLKIDELPFMVEAAARDLSLSQHLAACLADLLEPVAPVRPSLRDRIISLFRRSK